MQLTIVTTFVGCLLWLAQVDATLDLLLPNQGRQETSKCNGVSKSKQTIIKNPPTLAEDSCVYHIRPYSPNVCQLLVEFKEFELQQPVLDPQTLRLECGDHLEIGDFSLCGDNTGQHLYLPFNVAKGEKEIALTFNLPHRWSSSKWHLIVTQLECPVHKRLGQRLLDEVLMDGRTILSAMASDSSHDWELLAPTGCNQYFTKTVGTIKSFNFKNDGSSRYLPNMKYVICIKAVNGATIIEYQATKFSLSNEIESSAGYDGDCHSTIQTDGRREDYLMIPQSYVANSMNILPTYYCGTSMQTRPDVIASAPFNLLFTSDSITDETETGFSINYRIRNP
ncbi:uncharacterized protein LOC133337632 [Musca vetustissima]|uniref:uncharacterized protein LOC133337632 n=1 Tax=Musca vetustissima TaxID=27455 RepID=UPI002AB64774|nr:uncharacterized protein LOC133337632 [Musca vetustissima]